MDLRVDHLHLMRGERDLFTDLSFALSAGDALVVTGANGAGKSSLLRALAGLLSPTAGTMVFIQPGAERTLAESVHYLGHRDALKSALSVRENLRFWASLLAHEWRPGWPIDQALAEVALLSAADTEIALLSAGQRRRAALARLLVAQRPIWLLDEPSSALDAASQARLDQIMAAHRAQGGIIIAATHLPLGLTGAKTLHLGEAI